jgi:hypothetical protein
MFPSVNLSALAYRSAELSNGIASGSDAAHILALFACFSVHFDRFWIVNCITLWTGVEWGGGVISILVLVLPGFSFRVFGAVRLDL